MPLDLTNYGKPLAWSAAINAGTSTVLVWDDFFGNVRGASNTIGAIKE
jgi:hypothetical protein